ncbi:hypothetical protein DM860_015463 [Cuscuta australis]|uniref:DUF4219 domain-containing protein n=1 Tax=Cuscuta australis TaxID=267555 RepID=A0A328E6U5_9ASTE|nr:hypothetical protein DM860_015463 [Cuscuta australis]
MAQMDSQSIHRPPFFNGQNYSYWKMRMEYFIQSIDFDLWLNVLHGRFVPSSGDFAGLSLEDKRKLSMNAKAINILHCSLGPDEFARVRTWKMAKRVWDLLEATPEGDISTKKMMIALGNSEYESFKKGQCETIQDMNKRFNEIVNKLNKLGKTYSTCELNTKILFSLPKEWHSSIVDLLPKCDKAKTAHIWSSLYSHELLLRKIKEEEM